MLLDPLPGASCHGSQCTFKEDYTDPLGKATTFIAGKLYLPILSSIVLICNEWL